LFAQLTLAVLISRLIALLIGTTFHEYMHNYIGYLMGDNTPVYQGRLTLDPRKHIYWPGFLMFVVLGFGILGTAPINAGTMNNPRVAWGQRLTRLQRFGVSVLAGGRQSDGGNAVRHSIRLLMGAAPDVVQFQPRPRQPERLPKRWARCCGTSSSGTC
jgi:Zn-dependent protease